MSMLRPTMVACAVLMAVLCQGVRADRVYDFVNYPADQNGYTLVGTLTVTDTAPDDSWLVDTEVLHYSLTLSHVGFPDTVFTDTGPVAYISLTNVSISSSRIYLDASGLTPPPAGFTIGVGSESFIEWMASATGYPTPSQSYGFDFFGPRPGFGDAFPGSSHFGDQFIIATAAVPLPTSLGMGIPGILGLGLLGVWRRWKRGQPVSELA